MLFRGDRETSVDKVFAIETGSMVHIYVSVKDSGPGLKPGDLALLFQRFQQGMR